jgi:hypothetical protein
MPLQVRFDLVFCFHQKTQIPLVADQSSGNACQQRTAVSKRIQQAGPRAQFANA